MAEKAGRLYKNYEIARLRDELEAGSLVLLDYETNEDVEDVSQPLSHPALINLYLQDEWPAPSSPTAASRRE